jgi:pyruvate dehydrogenase E2 component (dihydrolipoamide acetyltransferase)
MAKEINLPQLGQTMEEGTIVNCLVKVGDKVEKGDVLFEIETDKATLEMESPAAGYVKHITAEESQTLPVGDLMMVLGEKDEDVPAPQSSDQTAQPSQKTAPTSEQPAPQQGTAKTSGKTNIPDYVNVINLPQLGQTMEEGTIVNCLVNPGDKINKGDVIFEVETDKATLEMESPSEGFVKAVLAEEGQTLLVGEPLMVLTKEDRDVPAEVIESLKAGGGESQQPVEKETSEPEQEKSAPKAAAPKTSGGRIIASPRAKKTAKELGIDLVNVAGSGPGGRITEKDVKQAPKTPAVGESNLKLGSTIPVNRLQKITGERMVQSKREIPCFYLSMKVDMTDLVEYREQLKKSDKKVAFNDFIIKAVAIALEHYPIMTGQLKDDKITTAESINVGLAMAGPDGLVVPVLKDVQKKDIAEVAQNSRQLIEKLKNNKIELTDLEGGVITVSNLGGFGVDSFIPIVVPGQCSILGIGKITDTCVPENGNIIIRKLMTITLSVDHKVANGAEAAQFLEMVRKTLEDVSTFH